MACDLTVTTGIVLAPGWKFEPMGQLLPQRPRMRGTEQACEYCGTMHDKQRCDSCGAPRKQPKRKTWETLYDTSGAPAGRVYYTLNRGT